MHKRIEQIGSMILVATVSRKSKILRPAMLISLQGPIEREQTELKIRRGRRTISTDFQRLTPKRSQMKAIETSAIDMVEVNAAIVSRRKNSEAHSDEAGILANTSGSVTKTNVVPRKLSSFNPNDVTAGNIINPMMIDTSRSSEETVIAVRVNFVSFGKYPAYVTNTPIPRLSEKNACPVALIMVSADIFEKSGFKKNDTPSIAPGSDRLTQTRIAKIKNRIGIAILDKRSIPFWTPAMRIAMLEMIMMKVVIRG